MLRVIAEKSERNGNSATVVVEGDTHEEVRGLDARRLVLEHATTLGMNKAGVTGSCWTEWVNEAGETLIGEAFQKAASRKIRAHHGVMNSF